MNAELLRILREDFGKEDFRPHQEEIVIHTVNGRNIFVCMPTGSGKSLTFLMEAEVHKGIIIIIQPLLALLLALSNELNRLGVSVLNYYYYDT